MTASYTTVRHAFDEENVNVKPLMCPLVLCTVKTLKYCSSSPMFVSGFYVYSKLFFFPWLFMKKRMTVLT